MKKKNGAVLVLAALAMLFLAVGTLLSGVWATAINPALYGEMSRQMVEEEQGDASAYLGLTEDEQAQAAREISAFLSDGKYGGEEGLVLQRADGTLLLSERESLHMKDVRGILTTGNKLSRVLLYLSAALAVVCAWVAAGKPHRVRTVFLGALIGLGVFALLAGGGVLYEKSVGFDAAFRALHELLFTNDLWLLDPETDLLLRMMPLTLFEQAAGLAVKKAAGVFAVGVSMLAAVYFLVDGMVFRHLTKKEEQA